RTFDQWLYQGGGWSRRARAGLEATGIRCVHPGLPWNMSFLEAAFLFNAFVFVTLFAGLSAWFGYRRYSAKAFRMVVLSPLLALLGAFIGASIAGLIKGVNPFDWLHDSATLRHIVTGALV